ncbi:hypothetical protein HK097_000301 [Rhizophlyctis rosea]|uniref:F-box domain-containing protein n=1 Tax=Rhizophlyctis rosea TaxID=64517 RepID=A0AAD5SHG7_9FUNG|nr:hypothetical protein HK097_000301 [Rhizophlyctis rosea]
MDSYKEFVSTAVKAYKEKDLPRSLRFFDLAVKQNPNNPEAIDGQIQVLMKLREWNKALEAAQKLVALDKKKAMGYSYIAKCYLETGRPLKVLKICQVAKKNVDVTLHTEKPMQYLKNLQRMFGSAQRQKEQSNWLATATDPTAKRARTSLAENSNEANKENEPSSILGLHLLPFELLHAIHLQLPFETIVRISAVCREWRKVVISSPTLWATLSFDSKRNLTNTQLEILVTRAKSSLTTVQLKTCTRLSNLAFKSFTIQRCKNLTHFEVTSNLNISATTLSNAISIMSKSLTHLNLFGMSVDDPLVRRVLNTCQSLTSLNLANINTISNKAFQICELLVSKNVMLALQHLNITDCSELDDATTAYLSHACPELRTIKMHGTKMTIATLHNLTHFPNLEELELVDGLRTGASGLHFENAMLTFGSAKGIGDNLRVVTITRYAALTDVAMGYLAEFCENLEEVTLSGCAKIGDGTCKALAAHCKKLRSVDLSSCPGVTTAALVEVVKDLHNLEVLNLSNNPHVDGWFLHKVVEHGDELTHLNLAGCSSVSGAAVGRLAQKAGKSLEYLNLDNCTGVHPDTITRLKEALPKARISATFTVMKSTKLRK